MSPLNAHIIRLSKVLLPERQQKLRYIKNHFYGYYPSTDFVGHTLLDLDLIQWDDTIMKIFSIPSHLNKMTVICRFVNIYFIFVTMGEFQG